MSARRVITVICCLCFFVKPSKSHEVDPTFVAKHVCLIKKDIVVSEIDYSFISEKFNEVQKSKFARLIKLQNNTRPLHTFFMTSNLEKFKEDLIKTYGMHTMKVGTGFIETSSIRLVGNVNIINFKIKFNKYEKIYKINESTCEYSSEGNFSLGAINSYDEVKKEYMYKINHLSKVKLSNTEKCNMTPPKTTIKLGKRPMDEHVCNQDYTKKIKCGEDLLTKEEKQHILTPKKKKKKKKPTKKP